MAKSHFQFQKRQKELQKKKKKEEKRLRKLEKKATTDGEADDVLAENDAIGNDESDNDQIISE